MSTSPENPSNEPETPQNSEMPPANPEAPSDIPEMQPAFTQSSSGEGGNSKGILVGIVCVLICAGAAWGIWKYINSSPAKIGAVPPSKASAPNTLAKASSPATNKITKAPSNIVSRTEAKLKAARAATGADDFDNEGKPIEKAAAKSPTPAPTPAPMEKRLAAVASKSPEKITAPPPSDLTAPPVKPIEKAVQPAPPIEQAAVAPAKSPEKTSFPEVRLQGIFYRLSRPSAMLSGQTLYVGDAIKGTSVKVKAIDRQSVTLEMEGETTVLTMR